MSKLKRLNEMMPGERGRVAVVSSSGALRCRMMEMGLVKGAELEVVLVVD